MSDTKLQTEIDEKFPVIPEIISDKTLDWVEEVYVNAHYANTGDSTIAFDTYALKAVASHARKETLRKSLLLLKRFSNTLHARVVWNDNLMNDVDAFLKSISK